MINMYFSQDEILSVFPCYLYFQNKFVFTDDMYKIISIFL